MIFKHGFERRVKKLIRNLTGINENFEIFLVTSGRSSFFSFFEGLDSNREKTKILIPDYVCNVVERSIRQAGFSTLIPYKINDNLLPDETDLARAIECHKPDIVVFAPIFGSYGESYYNLMKKTSECGAILILDFAQDLEITIPSFVSVAITSFNRKSINGFFGGVLIINKMQISNYSLKLKGMSFSDEALFFKLFFLQGLDFLKSSFRKNEHITGNTQKFDYSFCKEDPYTISDKEISFISLIVAFFEMRKVRLYRQIREKNYRVISKWLGMQKGVFIVETDHVAYSPYIPIRVEKPEIVDSLSQDLRSRNLTLKFPYGKETAPDTSQKKNLFAIESGFHTINSDVSTTVRDEK
jgi:hypothetical protein